jgi:hypothetical protein
MSIGNNRPKRLDAKWRVQKCVRSQMHKCACACVPLGACSAPARRRSWNVTVIGTSRST